MNPKQLSIADYEYLLPEERIAAYPLHDRDASKLLVYKQGVIRESVYRNLPAEIPPASLMVFNKTRVVEARLIFQKPSGGKIEVFCLEPSKDYQDITTAMSSKGVVHWLCLIGGASKWKPGQVLQRDVETKAGSFTLTAKYLSKAEDSFLIELSWSDENLSFAEVLHMAGNIPLPPYIKRKAESSDSERYQTVFAEIPGSVAAPTAGLHFTPTVFHSLSEKNIKQSFLTLHVGAGTFKPVKSATMEGHDMHGEWIDVPLETIREIRSQLDGFITCVGTTSLRTVESLYWIGSLISRNPELNLEEIELDQWFPYENDADLPTAAALDAIINKLEKNNINSLVARTHILIAPGYTIRIANALITNFHQPHSTLLLLVAAFIGENWKSVYEYALENDFRFLSYGDGCLLFRQ